MIDRETRFDGSIAPEASGIVVSRRDPSIYWLVDDGPETTSVVAISSGGETLGRVTMAGVVGRDTEDIAAGPCGPEDPSPCLFVGDIGDNLGGTWPSIRIHRFPEPDPTTTSQVEVATATYTYADGARDAEALVVDDLGRPVVLSKEEGVVGVYQSDSFADGVLARVAEMELPRPTLGLLTSQVGLHATAADRSPDGTRLLLRTYDSVVELIAPSQEAAADLSTIAQWRVEEPPAPFEPQGEAIAYLADGISYMTVSERSNRLTVVRR